MQGPAMRGGMGKVVRRRHLDGESLIVGRGPRDGDS